MAASSFFALLDDIAALLDDVALMSKTATQKTAGVLSDDLALNANQVSGVKPDRELPVIWAVAKGSLLNKIILVPIALVISFFIPWLITPLLMAGGTYLCFEGMEKIWSIFFHPKEEIERKQERRKANTKEALLAVEQKKNKRRYSHRLYFVGRNHCYFSRSHAAIFFAKTMYRFKCGRYRHYLSSIWHCRVNRENR